MRITTQADYGLTCALNLARRYGSGPVTINEISKEENLPKDYLEQLFRKLRKAGIVRSIRGPGGGYVLLRSPKEITTKDIIEAVETDTLGIICFRTKRKGCVNIKSCVLKPVWTGLKQKIEETLQKSNLALLLRQERHLRK